MIIQKSKLKMVQCLLSRDRSKKVLYRSRSQNQLVYPINAVVSLDNGCKKMHTLFNLLAKRTAMASKLVSLNPSKLIDSSMSFVYHPQLPSPRITSTTNQVLISHSSGQRVHAISEQWHHTHEDNCWVVDESDILKLMPQM